MDFNNVEIGREIIKKIHRASKRIGRDIRIMEVCGTHTRSIYNYGIPSLLPKNVKLISGPGCPICVTPMAYIDDAVDISFKKNVILATFSDVLRVPGSKGTLALARSKGADIRAVHSPLEVLNIARENKNKEVAFLGVGFETTASTIALALRQARGSEAENFTILNGLKTMPNALKALVLDSESNIDGFICPGHVGTIIGSKVFDNLARENNTPMAMCGFNSFDVLGGILSLVNMIINKEYRCKNLYSRAVGEDGNTIAKNLINEVFIPSSSLWRGLSKVENSGYKLSNDYKIYDARDRFSLSERDTELEDKCSCKYIITGKKSPSDCTYFRKQCTPKLPLGPCMVSSEGACNIEYSYK